MTRAASNSWMGTAGARRAMLLTAVFGAGVAVGAVAKGGSGQPSPASVSGAAPAGVEPAFEPVAAAMDLPGAAKDARRAPFTDDAVGTPAPDTVARVATVGADAGSTAPLAAIDNRLIALADELGRLRQRVASLEKLRVSGVEQGAPGNDVDAREDPPVLPVDTPEDRWTALVSAGVEEEHADAVIEQQAQHALARLALRDRAVREGWADSERFREESAQLRRDRVDLRRAVGEEAYDQYLFSTGVANRVRVESVIQGSAAEHSGLLPGDVIEGYADDRVFTARELREATAQGVKGETVPMLIRRGDEVLETWLPRGPIGIQLQSVRLPPQRGVGE